MDDYCFFVPSAALYFGSGRDDLGLSDLLSWFIGLIKWLPGEGLLLILIVFSAWACSCLSPRQITASDSRRRSSVGNLLR